MKCGDEVIKADAYVMAFGSYSTAMLKGIVDIPVYPLKGYSLTIPIAQEDGAPVSTILDETYKIAITRFDNRIRVGGMAEIVGFNTELLQPRRETLEMVVRDLYPRGGHVEQATFWTGLRPMTPDGTPVVGRTRFKKSVAEYRSRHARLDDGLRFRSVVKRSALGAHASDPV